MASNFKKGHKRKNSHLFQEQSTSGLSMNDYDIELDQISNDGSRIPPPLKSRTQSMDSFTLNDGQVDLENNPMHSASNGLEDSLHLGDNNSSPRRSINASSESWESWYLNKKFGNAKKRMIYVIIGMLTIIGIIFAVPLLFFSNSGNEELVKTEDGSSDEFTGDASIKRGFTIENVFNGEFDVSSKTFHFIDPPNKLKKFDLDPGAYFTVEDGPDGTKKFISKFLYDDEYHKDLGSNMFIHNGISYLVGSIKVNHGSTKLIFGTNLESEFRHSSHGYYWIKDVESGEIKPVTPWHHSDDPLELSFVQFSPNYNFITFVHESNIYLRTLLDDRPPIQITEDGGENIRNGKPDWVYEEEVLASDKAIWWAPDDSKFIFAKFDDSEVESFSYQKYTDKSQYPEMTHIKYPKPGSPNPKVSLFVMNVMVGTITHVDLAAIEDNDFILYDVQWLDSKTFIVKITDRYSKLLSVVKYDTALNELKLLRTINSNEYNGWIERPKKMVPIAPNKLLLRNEYGYVDIHADENGYNHIFYYPSIESEKGTQLTFGEWEVTDPGIVGYAHQADMLYFVGNKVGQMGQHLYAVHLAGSHSPDSLIVLQDPHNVANYYEFELSSSGRYVLMKKLGPDYPEIFAGSFGDVVGISDLSVNENVLQLSSTQKIKEAMRKFAFPVISYKRMKLDDDVEINYVEMRPAYMKADRKYPILVNVYGGPGSNSFNRKSSILLEQSVASGLDAIVLQIEPRGTGGKGWKFKSWANKKLGYWEPRDITSVTKEYIKENRKIIDTEHVAIWGWSYGGFSTLKTVEFDRGETFKYAIAVAPVTNWMYYDSIYTERYMGSVSENNDGYIKDSLISDIEGFKSLTKLLIMHGTADDNVHIQNTFEFVDQLNMNNIRHYDMHIFPDSDHSIKFHNAQQMIFERLYHWIEGSFRGHFNNKGTKQ